MSELGSEEANKEMTRNDMRQSLIQYVPHLLVELVTVIIEYVPIYIVSSIDINGAHHKSEYDTEHLFRLAAQYHLDVVIDTYYQQLPPLSDGEEEDPAGWHASMCFINSSSSKRSGYGHTKLQSLSHQIPQLLSMFHQFPITSFSCQYRWFRVQYLNDTWCSPDHRSGNVEAEAQHAVDIGAKY
jgi:hypothetical protein